MPPGHALDAARRPVVIAHRGGNSLPALFAAEQLGADAVEADIHLFRGCLEVRHLKTVGPVPILWDRWKLANPFARRLVVGELLRAVGSRTHLLLDLKGRDRRLSEALLEALRPHLGRPAPITLCARSWPLLEPFQELERARLVHSVGTARQLARLRRRYAATRLDGVVVHERLLDRRTARELRALADIVLTWPVNNLERARELVSWGVEGLISDRPAAIQAVTSRVDLSGGSG